MTTAPGAFELARLGELPTMLDGPNGRGSARALGQAQDVEQALLTDAVLMRYPPRTPGDALDILGADSLIERFDGEVDGTAVPPTGYQGRLMARWKTWKKAGSKQALIDSLNAYGITDVAVYQDFEDAFFVGDMYSRFQVAIGPDMGSLAFVPLVAPFTPDAEGTITSGSTATIRQVRQVKRQILKWKSAFSYPVRVILDFGTPESCSWDIGKLCTENINAMPFTPGGFEV